MADVSNIEINGNTYHIKDSDSRDKIKISLGERYVLKERTAGSNIEGYSYCAFAGGTNFAGYEIYAFRAGPKHRTYISDGYGEILFYYRTNANEFVKMNISLNYDSSTYGELRDPNLSVSRDGTRLYVSCFTTIDQSDTTHHSIIFVLDKTLTQVGAIIIQNSVFWGNTLETPDGYLLHADYAGSVVNLYRSSDVITDSNVGSISMTKILTLDNPTDMACAEPTIGYYKDKLICITRTSGTNSGHISYTYDLSGSTGWINFLSLDYRLHAPCLQCYSADRYIVVTASVLGDVTGNIHRRMPFICLVDFDRPYAMKVYGELIESKDNWAAYGYGGYTTLVKIDDSRYGVVYYEEDTHISTEEDPVNGLYFRVVNVNKLFGSTYNSLTNYDSELKWYEPPEAEAYSYSLLNWVKTALNYPGKAFDFVINVHPNTSSITDIPDEAKTTGLITGSAKRRGTAYFISLKWYNGNTNVFAEIEQNSKFPQNVYTWYISRLYEDTEVEITGNAGTAQYITLPFKTGYVISHLCVVSASSSKGFLLMPPVTVTNGSYTRAYSLTNGSNTVKIRSYFEPRISS